ncbi:hypothetical protein J4G37_62575, partial [Microvirga sp. 3-52]|nr:hypothetical protein [Microvirga sp. 3-52]
RHGGLRRTRRALPDFIPLVALKLDEAQRKAVTAEIERWLDGMAVGVPSAPSFSAEEQGCPGACPGSGPA